MKHLSMNPLYYEVVAFSGNKAEDYFPLGVSPRLLIQIRLSVSLASFSEKM